MYYYSTMRLILIYRPSESGRLSRPRHSSKCASHVTVTFVKTQKCIHCRFDPGTSRIGDKHATTRPLRQFMIDKISNNTNLDFKWLEVFSLFNIAVKRNNLYVLQYARVVIHLNASLRSVHCKVVHCKQYWNIKCNKKIYSAKCCTRKLQIIQLHATLISHWK